MSDEECGRRDAVGAMRQAPRVIGALDGSMKIKYEIGKMKEEMGLGSMR